MNESINVYCEECGEQVLITAYARTNPKVAGRQLPNGWVIWSEGRSQVKVLCPNHNDLEYRKQHMGPNAIEG